MRVLLLIAFLVTAPLSAQVPDSVPVPYPIAEGGAFWHVIVDSLATSQHSTLHGGLRTGGLRKTECEGRGESCVVQVCSDLQGVGFCYRVELRWVQWVVPVSDTVPEPEPDTVSDPAPDTVPEPEPEGYTGGVVSDLSVERTGLAEVSVQFTVPDDGTGAGAQVAVRAAPVEAGNWWWGSQTNAVETSAGQYAAGTLVTLPFASDVSLDSLSMYFQAVAYRYNPTTGRNEFSPIRPPDPGLRVDFGVWDSVPETEVFGDSLTIDPVELVVDSAATAPFKLIVWYDDRPWSCVSLAGDVGLLESAFEGGEWVWASPDPEFISSSRACDIEVFSSDPTIVEVEWAPTPLSEIPRESTPIPSLGVG